MLYTNKIKDAIRFATKTHEIYQKQKRKGKDIAYITHPLAVGLILARAGASEDVVVAGILHDTIEDSVPDKKVTSEMLEERFGKHVTNLVTSVTEPNKDLPWAERKHAALLAIEHYSHDSVLVKSADVINNLNELLDDHQREGEAIWKRFNAPKNDILNHACSVTSVLARKWSANPLKTDLLVLNESLQKLQVAGAGESENTREWEMVFVPTYVDSWASVIKKLDEEYPLIPYVHISRLYSTVRRMKAEKELGVPVSRRTGFVISTQTGKRANEMTEQEWENFYEALCIELKRDYPDFYSRVFPGE